MALWCSPGPAPWLLPGCIINKNNAWQAPLPASYCSSWSDMKLNPENCCTIREYSHLNFKRNLEIPPALWSLINHYGSLGHTFSLHFNQNYYWVSHNIEFCITGSFSARASAEFIWKIIFKIIFPLLPRLLHQTEKFNGSQIISVPWQPGSPEYGSNWIMITSYFEQINTVPAPHLAFENEREEVEGNIG